MIESIEPSKSITFIREAFQQGDIRYEDPEGAHRLAHFLDNKAIEIEKIMISDIEVSAEELKGVKPPQEVYKIIARRFLEKEGYHIIGYERWLCGGKVDVLAQHSSNKTVVAVECCSCRITKALDFLERENTILWILSLGESFPIHELPLFIVKRGPNWEKSIELYHQDRISELRKIKNILDKNP